MNKQQVEQKVEKFKELVAGSSKEKMIQLIAQMNDSVSTYEKNLMRELKLGLHADIATVEIYTSAIVELSEKIATLQWSLKGFSLD